MKDLHNHIFSNTTCISKETMLKYINKQLSKDELHGVETHMLDCELCTDAYEGMAYAQNASMLFAIDNQIDQHVRSGANRTPIMRNLMVAASVLVIVFGTYFTVNFFNETVSENNLAINEAQVEKELAYKEIDVKSSPLEEEAEMSEFVQKEERESMEETVVSVSVPKPVVAEQIMVEDEAQEFVAENIELAPIAVEPFVSEDAELEEEMTVQSGNQQKEMEEGSFSSMKYAADEKSSIEKDAVAKSKLSNTSALKKSGKKRRSKNVSSAPVMVDAVMELKSKDNNNADQKLLIIEGYKAVNYLKEYQEVYDDENVKILESNSVSAGYENKLDKENAEKAKEEMTVEVTYRETLEKAIHLYKVKSYRAAISEFDNILAKHPKDVNAQFYSGLCYFHLPQLATALTMFNTVLKNKETEFNEEASWYKALILIEIKNINGAKKLLNNIIEKGGFYKVKAEEKLKEL